MAKQAKKKTPLHRQAAFPSLEAVQRTEQDVLRMGRDNAENIMRTANDFNHASKECIGICTENLSACVESGSKMSEIAQNISSEVMESYSRTLSDFTELSKEAFACRTISDITELQNKAVQQISDNYFNAIQKLYSMLFDSCSETLEPLSERTAIASQQIRKVLAA